MNGNRRSTRLSIAVPVVISGVDTGGDRFSESVCTVVVNKHGGKIAIARRLAMGAEIAIENRHLGIVAKAQVVWLNEPDHAGEMHHVGLQLLEAQNVWGIAFPPDDWRSEPGREAPRPPEILTGSPPAADANAETRLPSLAAEEITIRLLQELQESADAHVREFQDRLKLLTHRLGWEFESHLRDRAAAAKGSEVGTLEEIKGLRESLSEARKIVKLEAGLQELKCALAGATGNPPPTPTPLQEARRQLTALTNSVVDSMNRAAEAGLREYRSLLQKENQQTATRLGTEKTPQPPGSSPTKS